MNKKFFRIALLCALLGTGAAVTSCTDYDQEIADLQESVSALEKKVSDIQAAINAGEVVTSVEKTANGIVVKTNKGSYEINNGKNGAPGTVVTIGENGNWFLDGKDTGVAAKGDKGDKGETGAAGQNGTNGTNGQDAEVKPEIKDGHLFINGVDCGVIAPKAIVAVVNGNTLTLTNVEGSMEPIVLNLKGGLTALVYRPGNSDDWRDKNYSATLFYKPDTLNIVATAPGTLTFKVFPADFDVKNAKFFFSDSYKSAEQPVQYVEGSAKLTDGILSVGFTVDTLGGNDYSWMTSLDVELNGVTVSSNYFQVNYSEFTAQANDGSLLWHLDAKRFDETGVLAYATLPTSYSFAYNSSLALADSVVTGGYFNDYHYVADALFPVEYTLSLPDSAYNAQAEKVANTDVLKIVDNKIVVNAEKWNGSTAAFKGGFVTVTATVNGVAIAEATVPVMVTLNEAATTTITLDAFKVDYADVLAAEGQKLVKAYPYIDILKEVDGGISAIEFFGNYTVVDVDTDDSGAHLVGGPDSLRLEINKFVTENTTGVTTLEYRSKDLTRQVFVEVPFEVTYTPALPEFDEVVVKDATIFSHKNVGQNRTVNVALDRIFTKVPTDGRTIFFVAPVLDSLTAAPVAIDTTAEGVANTFFKTTAPADKKNYVVAKAPKTVAQAAEFTGENNATLKYVGPFTSDKETVVLDIVMVLPNGSEHYFPATLKAEFASMYSANMEVFADKSLTASETKSDKVILGKDFAIKHGDKTIYSLGSAISGNADITAATTALTNAENALAKAQNTVDSLTAALAKFNDTLAVATADSLAKLAKIDSLNKADYMVEMPTFANLAEFAKSKEWNGLGKSYEWIKCEMYTTGHTGHYGEFFYFELNENGLATSVHIDMTQAEMNELWNQYKSKAAIHNAAAFENNQKLYNQTVIIAKDVHASDSIATVAKANVDAIADASTGKLKVANEELNAAKTAKNNASAALNRLVMDVAWSEGYAGSVKYFIKKADVTALALYGSLTTGTEETINEIEYYVYQNMPQIVWTANADKSRVQDLVVPVTVVAEVTKENGVSAVSPVHCFYHLEKTFNLKLTKTLAQ